MDERTYSSGALSVICSNLTKACEKQMRPAEAEQFRTIGTYFATQATKSEAKAFADLNGLIAQDLEQGYPQVASAAEVAGDRGALRCMTWGKKVTSIHKSVLARYEKQGDALLAGNNLFVCEACGFIAIAPTVPELCPICKAPASRFVKI
ncbi:MAG: rubredoxin [Sphaerochaetaceae bacterium]|jgi:hypothetical protein|nr:rubredoxin [Sphaerochaetaceae bacterium]MDX9939904.1 rubredoxin [Sphaerochaetaceae bacterium]